jgi:hypothetical protein
MTSPDAFPYIRKPFYGSSRKKVTKIAVENEKKKEKRKKVKKKKEEKNSHRFFTALWTFYSCALRFFPRKINSVIKKK